MTPRGADDSLTGANVAFVVMAVLHFAERVGMGEQVERPMIKWCSMPL
ncbi:hypothetical protein [Mycobacterium uberis]|nr:hypothetical protein [Mycobacterium uberis]